jgi:hypothetical protein
MKVTSLNRTVLAAVIGSALAVGVLAPASAQTRFHRPAQEQGASAQQDDATAREARRKEREEAAAARKSREEAQAAREQAPRQREQAPPEQMQAQREQLQLQRERAQREQMQAQREQARQQRELEDLRVQQERIREQNRQTRDRTEQAQVQRQQARDTREHERAGDRQAREDHAQQRAGNREEQRAERQERQQDRQQDRAGQVEREQRHADLPPARRLDDRQREQRIVREKRQARDYQQQIQTQVAPQAKAYATTLYHQHRSHGYHYQQQYYWRLLQMLNAWSWNRYNYWNDPYFYTADDYRYYRGGSWYSINRYGADILRQAINYGYQEGFYAGRADRMDGWRYDYRGAYVYRDANYGYRGFYVNQSEYRYYFRQGFRRGYEDGYYSRRHYGRSYNGSDVILGTVLSGILNLQAYRW